MAAFPFLYEEEGWGRVTPQLCTTRNHPPHNTPQKWSRNKTIHENPQITIKATCPSTSFRISKFEFCCFLLVQILGHMDHVTKIPKISCMFEPCCVTWCSTWIFFGCAQEQHHWHGWCEGYLQEFWTFGHFHGWSLGVTPDDGRSLWGILWASANTRFAHVCLLNVLYS